MAVPPGIVRVVSSVIVDAVGGDQNETQIANALLVGQGHRDGEVVDCSRIGNIDRIGERR